MVKPGDAICAANCWLHVEYVAHYPALQTYRNACCSGAKARSPPTSRGSQAVRHALRPGQPERPFDRPAWPKGRRSQHHPKAGRRWRSAANHQAGRRTRGAPREHPRGSTSSLQLEARVGCAANLNTTSRASSSFTRQSPAAPAALRAVGPVERTTAVSAPTNPAERPSPARPGSAKAVFGG